MNKHHANIISVVEHILNNIHLPLKTDDWVKYTLKSESHSYRQMVIESTVLHFPAVMVMGAHMTFVNSLFYNRYSCKCYIE